LNKSPRALHKYYQKLTNHRYRLTICNRLGGKPG
jgi:hypothetical protein